ncbi:NAD(P)H-binding protein [Pseudoclavibacter chungangensis]|uniref:NAD(P)H-binding protein n=1 Tax=Pseudoclavibacter chungangensis TaxID=587635 RepID=A0A7J5BNC9_9MICO|nr:NAD(P)H-binding protein [Pseudoclavibacter chungangensis]KAB1653598.1 NAD(P)H-binding protein [Pseudoclavibacter chungangensis]NYJ68700.1 uncharacterized protein YbjT (DUF2867 family) [Pseudoclavibacter chungangensis]
MSSIIVLGGHGKVARLFTPLLVEAGHRVTSVIRDPAQRDEIEALGATPVVADIQILDIDGFAALYAEQDAIVWSAGAGGGDPARTYAIDRDAAVHSIQAAQNVGPSRYLMVSWSGSRIAHGVPQSSDFFAYAQSKAIADAVLRDSGLDATIIAPSTLTDEPGTGLVEPAGARGSVPRADVAAVVAAAVDDPRTIGRTLRFDAGDLPIASYLARAESG